MKLPFGLCWKKHMLLRREFSLAIFHSLSHSLTPSCVPPFGLARRKDVVRLWWLLLLVCVEKDAVSSWWLHMNVHVFLVSSSLSAWEKGGRSVMVTPFGSLWFPLSPMFIFWFKLERMVSRHDLEQVSVPSLPNAAMDSWQYGVSEAVGMDDRKRGEWSSWPEEHFKDWITASCAKEGRARFHEEYSHEAKRWNS